MTNFDQPPRTVVPVGITDPVIAARAELKAALAAIEIKGNIPRRIESASMRTTAKFRDFRKKNPAIAVAAVVGVATLAGLTVWAIARAIAR